MKLIKRILKIGAIAFAIFVIGLIGASYYIDTHKEKIIDELKVKFDTYHKGKLDFKDVSVSAFAHFPSVSITLNNVTLVDSLYTEHKIKSIAFEELALKLSLRKLFQKKIRFKSLHIKNGALTLFTDERGYSNKRIIKKPPKQHHKSWLSEDGIEIEIENFNYQIINRLKDQNISGQVNTLTAFMTIGDTTISGHVALNAKMKEMGLKLKKGVFFENTDISFQIHPTISLTNHTITIPDFDIIFNKQKFNVTANFNTEDHGTFNFYINNPTTQYTSTVKLLPANLQKNLDRFTFDKPIHTSTMIEGSFGPHSNPFIKVNYHTLNNTLVFEDSIYIKGFAFKGDFISNRNGNWTLKNDTLYGSHLKIPFTFNKATLTGSAKGEVSMDTDFLATGDPKELNILFKNTTFLFRQGRFLLKSKVKGKLTNLDSLLTTTKSELSFANSSVRYKDLNIAFPIDSLNIQVTNKDAVLNTLDIPILDNTINFQGNISNVTALLFGEKEPIASTVTLQSKQLVWNDVMAVLKTVDSIETPNGEIPKNKKPKTLVINEFVKSLYNNFNPRIAVAVDEFKYDKFRLTNVAADLQFIDENELRLNNTGFHYRNGSVLLQTILNVSEPNSTTFDAEFKTNELDFANVIVDYDYFGLKSLKAINRLTGKVNVNAGIKGSLDNDKGLDKNTLTGKIAFAIDSLSISGFEPLEKVADHIFKKNRFEDIRFAPITNTVYIKNETVEIPQMEVQSTAFNLYLQGHLGYHNNTNIWVSVPLNNLKHRDVKDIPNKINYIDSGKKVYVQVVNKDSTLAYKFHLTNKKLYEQEGILNQYRKNHKRERKLFREYKRDKN